MKKTHLQNLTCAKLGGKSGQVEDRCLHGLGGVDCLFMSNDHMAGDKRTSFQDLQPKLNKQS